MRGSDLRQQVRGLDAGLLVLGPALGERPGRRARPPLRRRGKPADAIVRPEAAHRARGRRVAPHRLEEGEDEDPPAPLGLAQDARRAAEGHVVAVGGDEQRVVALEAVGVEPLPHGLSAGARCATPAGRQRRSSQAW